MLQFGDSHKETTRQIQPEEYRGRRASFPVGSTRGFHRGLALELGLEGWEGLRKADREEFHAGRTKKKRCKRRISG